MTPATAFVPLDGVTAIEASAGTGKTYTITQLYLRLLLEQPLDVASILVVTYTKAATAELRNRVRGRLVEAAGVFRDAEYFAINVLAANDAQLSSHFAKPGADKFAAYANRFSGGLGGVPLLEGAVATFECHSRYRKYGGDHIILIGVVERYSHTERKPLIFCRGSYA